jgi:hypothetical protein
MKTKWTIVFCLLLTSTLVSANDEKYIQAMQKGIKTINEAKDIAAYQESVNGFERIASIEKTKWEPLYYAAFGNIMMANLEKDASKKDAYLDRANTSIQQAKAINASESEIIALEGFVLMMRISVDPQSRGMVYSPQAMQAFNTALALNPENPRAMALLAQMQFGTAQFFNSSTADACAMNNRAADKIKTYSSGNPLAPRWGSGMIESLKEKCK